MQQPTLTHGSLFSGIGGFEVAAGECGIRTLWNCEIDPYCRLILKSRFPESTQYGDICKMDGGTVEPVDIISFGSPCQSFSIAGSRSGLDGASGLFYEAVRIIREMREATNGRCPRYCIMENVPGIYSSKSNNKSDFTEVLNELIRIKDKTITIPEPVDGKWLTAGAIMGEDYSLAWRTLSADGFGVAQRRRRMYLVLSFTNQCAGEILFEQEGKRRDFTPSYLKGEGTSADPANGAGSVGFEPGFLHRIGGHAWEESTGALRAHMGDNQSAVAIPINMQAAPRGDKDDGAGAGVRTDGDPAYTLQANHSHAVAIENHPQAGRLNIREDGVYPALTGRMGTGGGNCHFVMDNPKQRVYGISAFDSNAMKSPNPHAGIYEAETSRTLTTDGTSPSANQGGMVIAIQGNVIGRKPENGPGGIGWREDMSYALTAADREAVCYQKIVGALCTGDHKGAGNQYISQNKAIVEIPYAVRRLTPLECLRLQGFPNNHLSDFHIPEPTGEDLNHWWNVWEENRKALGKTTKPRTQKMVEKWLKNPYSDGNSYKAIGNALAVPCAVYVMRGITETVI